MALDIGRIEGCLGRDVHLYLRDQDPERQGALSSDLEYLLTGLWASAVLAQARWFDGLAEAAFKVRKRTILEVRGLMYWGPTGRDGRQWVDVFSANLRAVNGREDLAGYTLRFGRKGMEERRIVFGEHRELQQELDRSRGWEWAFVFEKAENGL
jgi:hypothetical protein